MRFFTYCHKEIIQDRRINPIYNKKGKQTGVRHHIQRNVYEPEMIKRITNEIDEKIQVTIS
jgi:hypothetical protein